MVTEKRSCVDRGRRSSVFKSGVVTAINIITHPTNLFGSEDSWRPSLTDSKDFTDKIFTESTQIYAELQRAPITQIMQCFIQPSFLRN